MLKLSDRDLKRDHFIKDLMEEMDCIQQQLGKFSKQGNLKSQMTMLYDLKDEEFFKSSFLQI
jgi:hypothetical protein